MLMRRAPRNPFIVTFRKPRRRRGSVQRAGGMSERKKAYLAFINSSAWRTYRAAWWQEYDRRHPVRVCWCCGKPRSELKRSLELHHRTYERLGREEWDDLVAVCSTCHRWITERQRSRKVTMTIWQITDARRTMMQTYNGKRKGSAGGR